MQTVDLQPTTGLLYFPIHDSDESEPPAPGSKRRRLKGACDSCRRRKVRCDSAKMPGNICSNCISFNSPCTHRASSPKEQAQNLPSSTRSPPQELDEEPNDKTAQEHVEAILTQSTAYINSRNLRNVLLDLARYARSLEDQLQKPARPLDPPDDPTEDDSVPDGILILTNGFHEKLVFESAQSRYFGRSSGLFLIQAALDMKKAHDGHGSNVQIIRRPEFWDSPWEKKPVTPPPTYKFPPQDLLDSLVSLFFQRINILICMLHRPTFEKAIAAGRHLAEHSFGAVVLAVCALASRYSDDPRVVLPGTNSRLSAGWEWFQQLQYIPTDFRPVPTLYDLQVNVLSILYLQGTNSPDPCFILIAIGLRQIQELGVHMRRRQDTGKMTVEDELLKRVFWILVASDALISAFLGRPRVMTDDDYDVDYPLQVDDEYWDHFDPQRKFQQPAGKPSQSAFITAYIKLMEILGMAQKTIYSVKRPQRGAEWTQTAVAKLDSALNEWLDAIPEHLRLDPHREDEIFATQSACLYASYYHVQIQIHRSFIPSPTSESPLASNFPSLAICANSARSCSHVMEAQAKRGLVAHPHVVSALMDSAMFLLLNVWGAQKTGSTADPQRAAVDVQKCISVLKLYERRWQIAGRHCDVLFSIGNQLIKSAGGQAAPQTLKRPRQPDHPAQTEPEPSSSSFQQQQPIPGMQLPIYTQDLGHLPVYESFDWVPLGFESALSNPNFSFDFVEPPQGFGSSQNLDWATRDWSTYVDSADQLMLALDSNLASR
ncbi:fungal-specific transcription factor domain-containing protein [Roridomyces roridus]|uniref:Fungal-specific transcription factor domain-containing protein n=1 Tax=Roridomyces roridus TaxID=1738132 RepID=A0AAD7CEA5_9AGAR|nr:fungal-specific transcription factor domain-containing protein [Roridomyces roridus]